MRARRILSRFVFLTVCFLFNPPADAAVELITPVHSSAVLSESGDGPSGLPRISADGRYVLFTSGANNLVSNNVANLAISLYVYDRLSNTLRIATSTNALIPARGDASEGSLSADGRIVLFSSTATNLGYFDRFVGPDIFQKDLVSGAITLINAHAAIAAQPAIGANMLPSMTPDGSYVLFQSDSTDAATTTTADTTGFSDVYVRDVAAKKTHLISRRGTLSTNQIVAANQASTPVAISTNGNFVLFYSLATDLTQNEFNQPFFNVNTQRVWLRDLTLQTNIVISRGATNGNRESAFAASMSRDGGVVAFAGNARLENINSPVTHTNVYARLMASDTLRTMPLPISLKTNLFTAATYVSPDGARVALTVTPRISNTNQTRLLIWDLASDAVAEIDLAKHGGVPGVAVQPLFIDGSNLLIGGVTNSQTESVNVGAALNVRSIASSVLDANADGSVIAFSTDEALVPGDLNNDSDVYVMSASGIELISKADPRWRRPTPDMSVHHLQSNDSVSDRIAFASFSASLVANDSNVYSDIFTWSKASGEVKLETVGLNGPANGHSIDPAISADGKWIAFISFASNLVANDTNKVDDVFLKSLETGAITRISESLRIPTRFPLWGVRSPIVISANGRYVGYDSLRMDVVTNTTSSATPVVFLFDRTTGETVWASYGVGASAPQRAIAIHEPNFYFTISSNLYVYNVETRERTFIGASNADPASTSDGSLIAMHLGASGSPRIYTYDPSTHLTNVVFSWDSGSSFRGDRLSISDNKVIGFVTHVPLASWDNDATNDVYAVAVNDPSVVRLATTPLSYPRGSDTLLPRFPVISRDGGRIFYLAGTNSPIDVIPRTNLFVADIVSGAVASLTAGADSEPAPHSTTKPVLIGGGVAASTTARDLVNSPFDKAHLIFIADVPDADNDSLPDLWEQAAFGSLDQIASADADNDGVSNVDEMFASTDPLSAESVIALSVIDLTDHIELRVRDASLRAEIVQFTKELGSGLWTTLPAPAQTTDGAWIYQFDKQSDAAFFRVVVQP